VFHLGPESKHDDAIETKAHKTLMHWVKMEQCATKEFKVYLKWNNVLVTLIVEHFKWKFNVPICCIVVSIMIVQNHKPTFFTLTTN